MVTIRITLKDDKMVFIQESHKGIILTENIADAFRYQSTLEFKVTWKVGKVLDKYGNESMYHFNKSEIKKFEALDDFTGLRTFDINEQEIQIPDDTFYVDHKTFRRLMDCGITSSHWLEDKDGGWIAFPKSEDYDRVFKIRYYERGLTHTLASHNNWFDRYDPHSWHGVYEVHHKCMVNPYIQQIYLLDLDCCHSFTIYEQK